MLNIHALHAFFLSETILLDSPSAHCDFDFEFFGLCDMRTTSTKSSTESPISCQTKCLSYWAVLMTPVRYLMLKKGLVLEFFNDFML